MLPEFIESLKMRHIAGAGFANHPGGGPRADATCWAILALNAAGSRDASIREAQQALVTAQSSDGRVCIMPQHKDAFWPTPLAMLAWHASGEYRRPQEKAARFLLSFDQLRIADDRNATAILGHDLTIRGWPWIAGTSPWLEPTAYCLMALRLAGFEGHPRTQEARHLMVNRQLPAGGWNYGNTVVYQQELRPMPETTGIALQAVAGLVSRQEVASSIGYLRSQLPQLATPFSLAWAVLGLAAWEEAADRHEHLNRIVDRQEDDAAWDTVSLSLLLLASHCENGLYDWLRRSREEVPQ